MSSVDTASRSMRRYLLWWITGSGLALVLCYTVLLELYLDFGVMLRAGNHLESVAADYSTRYASDTATPLPAGPDVAAYRLAADIPEAIREILPTDAYRHDKVTRVYSDNSEWQPALSAVFPACRMTPCEVLFLYTHQLAEHEWLYLVQSLAVSPAQHAEHDRVENAARVLGSFLALTLAALTVLLVNRIRQPVEELARWADSLEPEQLQQPPSFQFWELNRVAARLSDAFTRLTEQLAQEKRFLRHASHELRAPLAVISGNLEILEKIEDVSPVDTPKGEVLARLQMATLDMRQLTETLLWLHRPSEQQLEPEPVDLNELARKLIEENRHLVRGKSVEIEVIGADSRIVVPAVPCRIVVANLVRNAFQYTHSGRITLRIGAAEISIRNTNEADAGDDLSSLAVDYGFGLGLELVEQICARLAWTFEWTPSSTGRFVTVRFGH